MRAEGIKLQLFEDFLCFGVTCTGKVSLASPTTSKGSCIAIQFAAEGRGRGRNANPRPCSLYPSHPHIIPENSIFLGWAVEPFTDFSDGWRYSPDA